MTIQKVRLTGHFEDLLGVPLKGKKLTIEFRPQAVTYDDADTIIPRVPGTIVLDNNGNFAKDLPVGGNPEQWTYRIAELFGARRQYEILLTPPGPHDLSELAPASSNEGVVYKEGPPGPPGTGTPLVYKQTTPAAGWPINHNMNKNPVVLVFVDGRQVYTDVEYVNPNQVTITFPEPVVGEAHLL